jgi:hypothetical protein
MRTRLGRPRLRPIGAAVEGLPSGIASGAAPAPGPDSSFDGSISQPGAPVIRPTRTATSARLLHPDRQHLDRHLRQVDRQRVAAFTFDAFMSQGNFGNLCDTDNFGDPVVSTTASRTAGSSPTFAFKLDGSGNVVNPPGAFQCFAVSKTGDPVTGGGTSIRSPLRGRSTTIRSSESGPTASTCRPTCSATPRRARIRVTTRGR